MVILEILKTIVEWSLKRKSAKVTTMWLGWKKLIRIALTAIIKCLHGIKVVKLLNPITVKRTGNIKHNKLVMVKFS